jgi:hypothetical protein
MRRLALAVALAALMPAVTYAQQPPPAQQARPTGQRAQHMDEAAKPAQESAEVKAAETKAADADVASAPVHERRSAR